MDTLIITPDLLPTPEMVMNPNLDKEAHTAWRSGKTTEESLERLAEYLNIPVEPSQSATTDSTTSETATFLAAHTPKRS